jgi:hypothetical protein
VSSVLCQWLRVSSRWHQVIHMVAVIKMCEFVTHKNATFISNISITIDFTIYLFKLTLVIDLINWHSCLTVCKLEKKCHQTVTVASLAALPKGIEAAW